MSKDDDTAVVVGGSDDLIWRFAPFNDVATPNHGQVRPRGGDLLTDQNGVLDALFVQTANRRQRSGGTVVIGDGSEIHVIAHRGQGDDHRRLDAVRNGRVRVQIADEYLSVLQHGDQIPQRPARRLY